MNIVGGYIVKEEWFSLFWASSLLVWGVRRVGTYAGSEVIQDTAFLWCFPSWKEGLLVGDIKHQEKIPVGFSLVHMGENIKWGEGKEKK